MARWDSTNHSIGDVRDWAELNKLEITPDYQRRAVWSDAARVMLIDTILRDIPMPKFYIRRSARSGSTHRQVIDGQQRLRAILDFLRGDLVLAPPCDASLCGKRFTDLSPGQRDTFLNYQLDMNEFTEATNEEVRQVYSRVNKYMKQLNKQELRRADFPGAFLSSAETLALCDRLDEFSVFTPASRRRLGDVEFTSELLAFLLDGKPLDKKDRLDDFYQRFQEWKKDDKDLVENEFTAILDELALLFSGDFPSGIMPPLRGTRFRQKADFYSLFVAVALMKRQGGSLANKPIEALRDDFITLDFHIEPSSRAELLKDYAVRCVSDANSASSRRWRSRLLSAFLTGTYCGFNPDAANVLASVLYDITVGDFCPGATHRCPITDKEYEGPRPEQTWVGWHKSSPVFQMSNAVFISKDANPAALSDWHLAPETTPELLKEA